MKVVCIIQARVGSTRFYGKVLKYIGGKTVLEHVINRVKRVNGINEIVVATTILEKDNPIIKECQRLGVKYFKGSEDDVLSRYYYAAKENNADVVVRITSDCPLIDSEVTEKIIRYYLENKQKYDYVSNTIERTYPRGLDTEVFSFIALEKAFNEATSSRDKEHVTPYIYNTDKSYKIFQYKNKTDYSDLRWTLDTIEDYKLITLIYNNFKNKDYFHMYDIISFLEKNPTIKDVNKDIEQKEINGDIFLIPANETHCDLIYEWANDEEVRKNSFSTSKINYQKHCDWFKEKLRENNCNIYLLVNSNKFIGIARVEKKDNENTISYSIAKEFRGKGYGTKILLELENELKKKNEKIILTAFVKKENVPSIKIFEKLNYNLVSKNDKMKFEKSIGRGI